MSIENLKSELYDYGFNLFSACKTKDYNLLLSENKNLKALPEIYENIIIFGSGGNSFWNIFNSFKNSIEGSFLNGSENPIDEYTKYILENLKIKFPEIIYEPIYPFEDKEIFIDFQKLAVLSGLGVISPYLKLLLHKEYGSWISLRGVFFTNFEVNIGKISKDDFCSSCHKPCLNSCPVNAVTALNFNFEKCGEYRNKEIGCLDFCHVRKNCIIGQEHIYSAEEGIHRNKSSLDTLRKYYKFKKP